MIISQTWDLENIFRGGSASEQFKHYLTTLNNDIVLLEEMLKQLKPIKGSILHLQSVSVRLIQAHSFVGCLLAQNVHDNRAEILDSELSELSAQFANASNLLDQHLKNISEDDFNALLEDSTLAPISYPLKERRRRISEKLPLDQENLINTLSVDGYHGWSHLYGTVIGQLTIPIKKEGKDVRLSWGQAYTLFSSPNRAMRKAVFESSNQVWEDNQNIFAPVLNHIAGYRLKLYEKRGWTLLREPLDINRMELSTLNTMWDVIKKNKKIFVDYQNRRARLLGLKKLSWYDLEAPLNINSAQDPCITPYEKAAQNIVEKFTQFSPKMGAFARKAFEEKWIEAEDRSGKRPGGFCTDVPLNKESRIFMTYSGLREDVLVLAHELGHAFHNHVIFEQPVMARDFPMNLAETASTFAEMLMIESDFKEEQDPLKRINLMDGKLQRSVVFLFNIHARFLFESRFHEERKGGMLSSRRLCELMESAQKEAYEGVLEEYHPYFWASKMHFSSTGYPFYNFPYTFGYLFSLGVYQKACTEKHFEDRYIALLADTGRMSAEELAQKHLGEDLTQEHFWQSTLDFLKRDAEKFLELTEDM